MNKKICIFLLLLTCRICDAQNLVPNGDFESYHSCPNYWGQIDSALFWTTPITFSPANAGKPDYFNQCSSFPGMSVPDNFFGNQQAHSANAYAGLYVYNDNVQNAREYIEVPLTSPLSTDSCYHFEMYVNLGDSCKVSIDDIGIYFSVTLLQGLSPSTVLLFTPQITNVTGNYFDHQNWKLVTGDYTAIGGESYLTIGNFEDDANTDTIMLVDGVYHTSYVFVDDVSLIKVPCVIGLNDTETKVPVVIYPNPFTSELTLDVNSKENFEIILTDLTSRKLFQEKFISSITLNTEQLAKGIYLYEVKSKNGVIKIGKVVKN